MLLNSRVHVMREERRYRYNPVLPVMFVVRQNVFDLGQLVLQVSVGVDLDQETAVVSHCTSEPLKS